MPELIQTLKSKHKQDSQHRKFLAGLQGVDINNEEDDDNEENDIIDDNDSDIIE